MKVEATPENIQLAKEFLLRKWKERGREPGRAERSDLSDACKFASMFAERVFGGESRGNWHHEFVVLDGEILDLTDYPHPHFHHDPAFWRSREHRESRASCEPRVRRWVDEWAEEFRARRRATNPTQKRLAWIAARYPAPVLYDTITALAAATAQHHLLDQIRFGRAGQWQQRGLAGPITPELALEIAAPFPQTHTRFDRHLPWVAATLSRQHKKAMKLNRRIVAEMAKGIDPTNRKPKEVIREDVVDRLAEARDADDLRDVLAPFPFMGQEYARARDRVAPGERGHGKYRRMAGKLEENLIAIVDWAEAEGVDLSSYRELDDVIEQAHTWAEAQAELLNCDEVGPSPVVYCWPDGWTVQELLTTEELFCEGRILAHCVRDYTVDDLVVGGGDSRFFSLRDPTGKRVTTMMFDTTKRNVPGHALRGFANKRPEVPELSRMYEFRMQHPDLKSRWIESSHTAGPAVTRSGNWEGRYKLVTRQLGMEMEDEVLDAYGSGLFDAAEASQARDWLVQAFEHSEYESALEWLRSPDFAEQREDQGLPPMTEAEMEDAAQLESERQVQEQLDDFDPETLRHDYGYAIHERTFNGQEALAGDLAWVHFLATGEDLGGWDEGDEMADWMKEYRSMQSPRTGFAFYGTQEPAIHLHSQGSRRIPYPFPPGADYGVVMRLVVPEPGAGPGSTPPHWRPERLHAQGTANCVAAVKERLLA